MMHSSVWFEFFWWFIFMSKFMIYGREIHNKEWDLEWDHPFPRVSNIREGMTLLSLEDTYNKIFRGKHGKVDSHDPCLVLSESDSKLYSNFEYCEERNHRHWKNILIYKARHFSMTKSIPRIVYIF